MNHVQVILPFQQPTFQKLSKIMVAQLHDMHFT